MYDFDTSNILKNEWDFQFYLLTENRNKTLVMRASFRFFLAPGSTPSDRQRGNGCNFVENKFRLIIVCRILHYWALYPKSQTDWKSDKNSDLWSILPVFFGHPVFTSSLPVPRTGKGGGVQLSLGIEDGSSTDSLARPGGSGQRWTAPHSARLRR